MPGFPELVKERIGLGNAAYPANSGVGISYTGTVALTKFARVMFHLVVGVLTGNATVQAGLQTGNNSNGSDGANFSGSAIGTNIGIANQQATFEFAYGATETAGTNYARGYINVVGNSAYTCGIIYGVDPRYGPGSSNNSADVNTQVAA